MSAELDAERERLEVALQRAKVGKSSLANEIRIESENLRMMRETMRDWNADIRKAREALAALRKRAKGRK